MGDLARELRDDYPAVDVTTVVFSRDFAGVSCCVIPQDKVLAVISALEGIDALVNALQNARRYIDAVIVNTPDRKKQRNFGDCLRIIDAALAKVPTPEQTK